MGLMQGGQRMVSFNPKLEFPRFDGSQLQSWIIKASKDFNLYKVPEEQWVDIASLNMLHRAEVWANGYLAHRLYVSWGDF